MWGIGRKEHHQIAVDSLIASGQEGPFRPSYLQLCRQLGLRRKFQIGDNFLTAGDQVLTWVPISSSPVRSSQDAIWVPRLDQTWRMIARLGYRRITTTWVQESSRRGVWKMEARTIGGFTANTQERSVEECALRIAREYPTPESAVPQV